MKEVHLTDNNLHARKALGLKVISGTAQNAGPPVCILQPKTSRALSELEARIGVILFTREHSRLRPTAEAMKIYDRLGVLFQLIDNFDATEAP